MLKPISNGISAQVILYQSEDRRPQGLICHAIWILASNNIFIIYYQAKIAIVNGDKILKYLTTDLFVITYIIDIHFLHGVLTMGDVANISKATRADMGPVC